MPTVLKRAEQNLRNRAAILDAARTVFLEAGYHGTTVETIARRAGFTTGALYSRFAGKADLFLALLEQRIDERARQFADMNPARDAVLAGPMEGARRWAEIMRTDLEWSLLVIEFRVHAARDPELAARYAQLHERSLTALAENIVASMPAEVAVGPDQVLTMARVSLAAATGAALARAAEGDDFSDELYEEILVSLAAHFTGRSEATAQEGP